jgi:hypothetical protein
MLTFFSFSSENITALTGYITNFITDISPLLIPVIAIGLGILIVSGIISAIKH